jgi:hypothetical protein
MDHSYDPTRNLALELVRVTEAAALAAGRFMAVVHSVARTLQKWIALQVICRDTLPRTLWLQD